MGTHTHTHTLTLLAVHPTHPCPWKKPTDLCAEQILDPNAELLGVFFRQIFRLDVLVHQLSGDLLCQLQVDEDCTIELLKLLGLNFCLEPEKTRSRSPPKTSHIPKCSAMTHSQAFGNTSWCLGGFWELWFLDLGHKNWRYFQFWWHWASPLPFSRLN